MVVPLRMKTKNNRDPSLSKRAHAEIMRGTMLRVGIKWAVDLLPEHFDPIQQKQFHYADRSSAWKKRKRRLFQYGVAVAPDTDLVFRGTLGEMVTTSARQNIRAFPSRCRVRMDGPVYFTLRARSAHTKRLAEEVLMMSPRHNDIIRRTADTGFGEEYRAALQARRMQSKTTTS